MWQLILFTLLGVLLSVAVVVVYYGLWSLWQILAGVMPGRNHGARPANPSTTTKLSAVLMASLLLVSLSCSGCSSLGGGPSKTLPAAEQNSKAIGEHVAASLDHIKTAVVLNNRTLSIMDDVQAGKVTIAVALPEIRQQIVQANVELAATQVELAATQRERAQLDGELSTAVTEKAAETARADKFEAKYENQWFAGKFWKMFWTLVIVGGILAVVVIILNIKTDLFVVPFQHIGKWLADMVGGTVRAFWNVCKGVWDELASLFKKATPPAGGT